MTKAELLERIDLLEEDVVFEEKKVGSYRIATMGRFAEIGKVNWEIRPKELEDGKKGNAESFYSINKQSKD